MNLLTPDEVKLGFIGIGQMGSRIAQRLLKAGYHLTAYDRSAAKAQALAVHGGEVSTSIAELAQTADVILSCLTNDRSVQDIYYGAAGVLANARPGAVMLEMSTVLPRTSRDLQQGPWRQAAGRGNQPIRPRRGARRDGQQPGGQ